MKARICRRAQAWSGRRVLSPSNRMTLAALGAAPNRSSRFENTLRGKGLASGRRVRDASTRNTAID
jgi:hypothetical protein